MPVILTDKDSNMEIGHACGSAKAAPPPREVSFRESELRYRRLFEAARDGILILDADTGRITDVNPFLVELLGFSHGEMVGKTVGELSPFRDALSNQTMLERLQRDGYIRYEDLPLETRDGRKIAVEFVCNVYQAGTERVIQCNIRDITERKRAEAEFHESQQVFEGIINSIPVRVFWKNKDLVYLGCNTAFARDAGFADATEIIGRTDFQLGWREQAERYQADDRQVILTGLSKRFIEEPQSTREGGTITLLSSKTATRNAKGEVTGVVGTYLDITERKALEHQLQHAQKMESIGTLAGGVAHDFNNIMAVIQLESDMLKSDAGLSPDQLESIEGIGAATQRALALTRQLLLFSHKKRLQLCDLDLNQSIHAISRMLERILGEDIEIEFKISEQPLLVHADAGMLDQVLMNLAVNSRDAMPKGGLLVIETFAAEFDETVSTQSAQARPGSFVCLSVSDNGCGIPDVNLPRVFDPFFTTKEAGKGTGLGLATLFGVVQQHHGWVNVYSELGRGTTFRIYLPRLSGISSEVLKPSTRPVLCGGNETILLVEDDPLLRPSLRKTLVQLGYRVFDVGNGLEALEVWNQHRDEIQLLLTDLSMPGGMNGKELSERLAGENPKLKVVYASGYSAAILSREFPLIEGVNYLAKPFQESKLAQTLRRNLDTT